MKRLTTPAVGIAPSVLAALLFGGATFVISTSWIAAFLVFSGVVALGLWSLALLRLSTRHTNRAVQRISVETPPKSAASPAPPTVQRQTAEDRKPIVGQDARDWIASRVEPGVRMPLLDDARAYRSSGAPYTNEISTALIGSAATWDAIGPEFDSHPVGPSTWRGDFEQIEPSLLLSDDSWFSISENTEHTIASAAWHQDGTESLRALLQHCRTAAVPTALWVRGTAVDFTGLSSDEQSAIAGFDHVFVADDAAAAALASAIPGVRAGILPPAVQPQRWNPLGRDENGLAIFTGEWPGASSALSEAFATAFLQHEGSRALLLAEPGHCDDIPAALRSDVWPAVRADQLPSLYRQTAVALVHARNPDRAARVESLLKLAASGVTVMTDADAEVREFFGGNLLQAGDRSWSSNRDRQRQLMMSAFENTYGHRAESILDAAGLTYQTRFGRPSGFISVRTAGEFERAVAAMRTRTDLDGLLVEVAAGADQSLEFELYDRQETDVVIVHEAALRQREYRMRSLLTARGIVTADADGNWPDVAMLRYLASHEPYYAAPVQLAADNETLYTFDDVRQLTHPTFVPATRVAGVLEKHGELPTRVLRV